LLYGDVMMKNNRRFYLGHKALFVSDARAQFEPQTLEAS